MKKSTSILIVALALLLAVAMVLYKNLSGRVGADNLSIMGGATETVPQNKPSQPQMPETTAPEGTEPANKAPDFHIQDMEGNLVSLSDFQGKPVVLNFWASWCGPCKMEMPEFQRVWEEKGEDIHFLMVNLTDGTRETVDGVTDFIAKKGYSFPVYFDVNMEGSIAYGVSGVPVTYFIDAEGHLAAYGQGAMDEATLRKGIEMIQK